MAIPSSKDVHGVVIHNSRMSESIAWQIPISFYFTPLVGFEIKAVEIIEPTITIIPSEYVDCFLIQHTGVVSPSCWLVAPSILGCSSRGSVELRPLILPDVVLVNIVVVDAMLLLIPSEEVKCVLVSNTLLEKELTLAPERGHGATPFVATFSHSFLYTPYM